jgi:hypothetical protein
MIAAGESSSLVRCKCLALAIIFWLRPTRGAHGQRFRGYQAMLAIGHVVCRGAKIYSKHTLQMAEYGGNHFHTPTWRTSLSQASSIGRLRWVQAGNAELARKTFGHSPVTSRLVGSHTESRTEFLKLSFTEDPDEMRPLRNSGRVETPLIGERMETPELPHTR